MAEVPPLWAARLQELKATFDGHLACMLRGGFAPAAMMLRYMEHLELEMLKWHQFMARPAPDVMAADVTAVPAVPAVPADVNTDNDIVDISDDSDDDDDDTATAMVTATAVAAVAAVVVDVVMTAVEAEESATAVEAEESATAPLLSNVENDDDDDGENAQRDPFMTPFSARDIFTPLALEISASALETSALETSALKTSALETSALEAFNIDTSVFDISELDMFLQTLVSASPAEVSASPAEVSASPYPFAVYRFDPVTPPTPPPTPIKPTAMIRKLKPLVLKPSTPATPEPKRQRNVLQAVNTGFSATDSTVEYFPDFEDNAPTHALLTRAPPKYAPPKFDVIRIKNYKK